MKKRPEIVFEWKNTEGWVVINLLRGGPADCKETIFNKSGNQLNEPNLIPYQQMQEKIWSLGAEIFIPAASSRLINARQVQTMTEHGLEVIACGANVPFNDPQIFFGSTTELADEHISLIPDFIANCGMARVFAYLMENNIEITDEAIFTDVSQAIRHALEKAYTVHPQRTGIAAALFKIALEQLA